PWDEREVLSEYVLADQPWAAALLRLQRRDLDQRLALLRRMPLLAEMDQSELRALAVSLLPQSAPHGRRVVVQGGQGDRFYIVVRGAVDVRIKRPDGSVGQAAVLTRGDYFGERALLNDAPRSATCIAATPVELLTL